MTRSSFQIKLLAIQRNLLSFAYSLTSDRDDAYDLLQDTTLRPSTTKTNTRKTPTSRAGFSR